MNIVFYNVKKREKVSIDSADVAKEKYEAKTKVGATYHRYALKAVDDDGTKLTKFCNESDWNFV